MGGASIFRLGARDPNINVVLEHMTGHNTRFTMVQTFIPDIINGDKRILMINGKPVDFVLARIPKEGRNPRQPGRWWNWRGAAHQRIGIAKSQIQWVPNSLKRGIIFAGLDVIGDRITEINVTSPTCIRELNDQFGCDIAGDLLDEIENLLKTWN